MFATSGKENNVENFKKISYFLKQGHRDICLDNLECHLLFFTVRPCMNSEIVNSYSKQTWRMAKQ